MLENKEMKQEELAKVHGGREFSPALVHYYKTRVRRIFGHYLCPYCSLHSLDYIGIMQISFEDYETYHCSSCDRNLAMNYVSEEWYVQINGYESINI